MKPSLGSTQDIAREVTAGSDDFAARVPLSVVAIGKRANASAGCSLSERSCRQGRLVMTGRSVGRGSSKGSRCHNRPPPPRGACEPRGERRNAARAHPASGRATSL